MKINRKEKSGARWLLNKKENENSIAHECNGTENCSEINGNSNENCGNL